ncbi:hypothetical protein SDC9_194159 [bioreactor metagenome]|uniref:Uncharacterized protein n=1 Tax=bioreactor metagenome TaxID=1076179 RepID=A0A645I850_9ZZZZ
MRKRKNIMLTASNIAATYSDISLSWAVLLLRASTEMVAVLLYNPPITPDTNTPDSRKT